MDKMKLIDGQQLRKDLPELNVGDEIKIFTKTLEAGKVRVHPFEGTIISKRGQGMGATFTMRKVSFGENVERTFPVNSPSIDKIEVLKKGKVKKSKIYYLSERFGKAAKIKGQK